uniref:Spermatogenesis-associated protein 6 N-terminal domain-containing protein n=1 Tax=Callorhinchus milii TaxID=7868 RepID=A0A4W3HKS1_CALMI
LYSQFTLQCIVATHLFSPKVTCPGVILPRKDDILLRVCVLGQHWKTRCIIPVFPLLIHESVQFEKVSTSNIIFCYFFKYSVYLK